MLTFIQFITEDTKEQITWVHHPVHGFVSSKYVQRHETLYRQHPELLQHHSPTVHNDYFDPARGFAHIDHKNKHVVLDGYHSADHKANAEELDRHVRTEYNVPHHYKTHLAHESLTRTLEHGRKFPVRQVAEAAQVTPEEKWGYEGPKENVPFPVHHWKHDPHIPGVDREQAKKHGKIVRMALKDLHATQSTVRKIDTEHVTAEKDHPLVVRKGGKNWIQDGHHRLTQAHKQGKTDAEVRLVDKDK